MRPSTSHQEPELEAVPDAPDAPDASAEEPSCIDTAASADHCGACGAACADGEVCHDSACACSGAGLLECGGHCIDSSRSKENCGACGHICEARCVRGECDPVLGDCASPLAVDPEGETVLVDFFRQGSENELICEDMVFQRVILRWVPSRSGAAFVDFDRGSVALGVSTDPSCESWFGCNDFVPRETLAAAEGRLRFSARAGETYFISAGRSLPPGDGNATIGIEVGFE